MRNGFDSSRQGSARCCAICGGQFGLVRYYNWRKALCSRRCVNRLKARQVADLEWYVGRELRDSGVSFACRITDGE